MNPFSTATQTMLGSVASRVQKSGAPGAGPQSTMRSRPAASVSCTMAATPPSIWETRKPSVRAPAPRNISAWNTFVHTTAETPPVAMYAIDTTTVTTIVVSIRQPTSSETAMAVAVSRAPEPVRRVRKKKSEPVTCVARPKRSRRNS